MGHGNDNIRGPYYLHSDLLGRQHCGGRNIFEAELLFSVQTHKFTISLALQQVM